MSDAPEPKRPENAKPPRRKGDSEEPPRPMFSASWLTILLLFILATLWFWRQSPGSVGSTVDYMFFWKQVEDNNVERATFHGDRITGKWKQIPPNPNKQGGKLGEQFNTTLPPVEDRDLLPLLRQHGVQIASESSELGFGAMLLLWMIGPLLIIGFLWLMMRRSGDPMGTGMISNFIRSPAKRFRPSEQQTTFDDVASMEQAKAELQEIVEFLKNPAKFQRLGAQIPKGVLLMGPPGTGKTLLARATAGEAGVPFFSINGSEFIQMFVGVGASRVRDMFRTAKESSPCILFIDEIDAVGRVRGAGLGGGHDEREQTLNQILSEMDGFQQTEAVIVLAATNRPDVLDPALLRPGRFDRHITVDRPSKAGRVAILKVHSRKVPLADDVDMDRIGAGTIGFSGAELKNLVNEAALNAARDGRDRVTAMDFEIARDRVLMGPRREEVLSQRERQMTAYHEAGHALLAWYQPDVDPVHKVTVIPRGRALGVTQLLPNEERYNVGEHRLHSQLAFMLGGRAAEKIVFDEYSAGAEDDLRRATDIARRMVSRWGMSEKIGPVAFRDSDEHPFLGKEIVEQRTHSEVTARVIDEEVQTFLNAADERAKSMLRQYRKQLDDLTNALVEKESLTQEEMIEVIGPYIPRSDAVPESHIDTPADGTVAG